MKTLIHVVFAAVCFASVPSVLRAGEFEGVIHMKTNHFDMNSTSASDWYIKGDVARIERPREDGQNHVMIVDGEKRTMVIVMPEKKTAMEFNLDQTTDAAAEMMKEQLEKKVIDRTGKSDKVAGYPCAIWRITDKETKKLEQEICVAKGLGKSATFFLDPKRLQQSSQPSWVKQLVKEGGFGLRTLQYGDDGKETSRTEVISIERKSLDRSLFVVPADYARQNMTEMANRMKAAREQMQKDQGQGGIDFEKMMRESRQRRAQQGGEAGAQAQQDVNELMKKFGEMMKKQQPPQGGQ